MPIDNRNNGDRFSRYYPSATKNHPVRPAPPSIKRGPLQIKLLDYLAQNGLRLATLADQYSIQAPSLRAWLDTDEPLPLAWIGVIGPLVGLPAADTEPLTTAVQQSRTRIHVLTVPKPTVTHTKKLQKPEATPTSATTTKLYSPEPKDKTNNQNKKNNATAAITESRSKQDLSEVTDAPKQPPQPRPVTPNQLLMVQVHADKMRRQGGNPDAIILEMSQGRPLENLTHNEVTRIIAELNRRTDGKMKALQQQLKTSNKNKKNQK